MHTNFVSLVSLWRQLQFLSLVLMILVDFAIAATAADIAAIILPLASTVWAPGKSATISYRISGNPDNTSYEIDLMTGEPNNAQLVHIFDKMAVPTASGVNSVTVQVPATLPEGKYGIRLGLPNGSAWKYSQLFAVSKTGQPSDNVVKHSTPSANATRPISSASKAKDDDEESKSHSSSRSHITIESAMDQHATVDSKPTLAGAASGNSRLAGLPALALAIVAASF
ncbi:hypothetical protein GGH94_006237 [Coemansia aciculifera]|uniref:Yeast cell wall synthesis Kre9/Knh1-like N-terminal domain-containing protein n=1 Tax=Coemansia aciculifera TaxID=417176 RepID=A0A9W8IC66_9FUNG|nr:hypothetical protein GGH94_006237 [Coemansia aciculifera]